MILTTGYPRGGAVRPTAGASAGRNPLRTPIREITKCDLAFELWFDGRPRLLLLLDLNLYLNHWRLW
jgi:hypothetical protein